MNYCPVKNRTLHKIQCSGIGNINFLDLKEAEFLTLNTVEGPEWRIELFNNEYKKFRKALATKIQSS